MNRLLMAAALISAGMGGCGPGTAPGGRPIGEDLASARAGFVTKLRVRGPAPSPDHADGPPAGLEQVAYPSGKLTLKGWLASAVGDARGRPAVVYLHGGWSLDAGQWEDARPLAEAGFVLLLPMLRGENGNPGIYEGFLGEVDDAIAAGRFVASRPEVDPDRVFVAGHSVGGVLACLASMLPSPFRAAASFDGSVDTDIWSMFTPDSRVPYDRDSDAEVRVRNPLAFAGSIRRPLRLYAGDSGRDVNARLAAEARLAGKDCSLEVVPGDHHVMLAPAVPLAIAWFRDQISRADPPGQDPPNGDR